MEIKDVVAALIRIENRVIELVTKQAEHNVILQEHKNYSLALQKQQEKLDARIEPIEKHVHLVSSVLKMLGILTIGFLGQWLVKHLL